MLSMTMDEFIRTYFKCDGEPVLVACCHDESGMASFQGLTMETGLHTIEGGLFSYLTDYCPNTKELFELNSDYDNHLDIQIAIKEIAIATRRSVGNYIVGSTKYIKAIESYCGPGWYDSRDVTLIELTDTISDFAFVTYIGTSGVFYADNDKGLIVDISKNQLIVHANSYKYFINLELN